MTQLKTFYADAPHGVTIDLTEAEPCWLLNRIHTNRFRGERGKGYAAALIKIVLADADADGISLMLSVEPHPGVDYNRLRNWYVRLGFRQFSPDDHSTLIRTPERTINHDQPR